MDSIKILDARTHNLKSVDLDIPHNQITVITGVSGSGKSSLAIDTLYAEGQRQYIESLSTYARQFLSQLQRPDIGSIEGLQPTLCIDQKSGTTSPRSTVATVTEVYDYMRLLMARVGIPSCFSCGEPIVQQSPDQILATIQAMPLGTKLIVFAPVVRGRRGSHREELSQIRKAGLLKVRVDGETYEVDEVPDLAVRKNHTIEAIVDKIVLREGSETRLADSIQVALRLANGLASVSYITPDAKEKGQWSDRLFSTLYSCANCGVSYEELEPRTFSFNSPYGACPDCDGVGHVDRFDGDLLVRDWKVPACDAFEIWELASTPQKRKIKKLIQIALEQFQLGWKDSLARLSKAKQKQLLENPETGTGLIQLLENFGDTASEEEWELLAEFVNTLPCESCHGARLRPESLSVRIGSENIFEICSKSISDALNWCEALEFDESRAAIAQPIVAEMLHRLRFLDKVGVGYLALTRSANTLSGGELQRVRLATSIGSGLVGVSYILDEPSIGLHQRDNDRLIGSLRDLQSQGNTVIVVEHDEAMMRAADRLVDVGPGAGNLGGQIVAEGTPAYVEADQHSVTAGYLRGELSAVRDQAPRPADKKKWIRLAGATLHNLQNVKLDIPVGLLVGITGVSGSGKSSLISKTLVPALKAELAGQTIKRGQYKKLSGADHIDRLIEISQKPIGRSPRSTPATYCGVFDLIRKVWANTRESKQRGYTLSRFSFNSGTGRCSVCQGQGQEKIEMHFLPDLFVTCSGCNGRRFNRQTLQVKFKEKSIADILEMPISEACKFFESFSKIKRFLDALEMVGLGYLRLGQSSSTLSGGEAQRIKLATELAKSETGNTIYFLDEPTTGLHFEDVRRLVGVLDGLVLRGNTVVVIEHNLDVIKSCDWLIDMGPEGGKDGGEIIGVGPPEELGRIPGSLTGQYLQ